MAGGALGGMLGAALRIWFTEEQLTNPLFASDPVS